MQGFLFSLLELQFLPVRVRCSVNVFLSVRNCLYCAPIASLGAQHAKPLVNREAFEPVNMFILAHMYAL